MADMTADDAFTHNLSRRETTALRELLVQGVALSDRLDSAPQLAPVVERAPLESLSDAAWMHRVSGTVERTFAEVPGFPTDVLEQLRDDAEHGALHSLAHLAALREVGETFDNHDISWLAMKGPVTAHVLHTRPSDRMYADLDILVHQRDFPTAVGILERLGFNHTIKNWRLAEEMVAGQIELTSGPRVIDLHWHLHYSRFDRSRTALLPSEMLERKRFVDILGQMVPTLDPIDTVLTLAYHAARSDGHRLIWLKDIERALAVESLDLDELVRRSQRAACGPQVGIMLLRVRELLQSAIPREIIDALAPPAIKALDKSVRRFSEPVQFHERPTPTRFVTRSIGRSSGATVADLPRRALRQAVSALAPPKPNETSDPDEKQRFFEAVLSAQQ